MRVIVTSRLPHCKVSWPGPWPLTSALGLSIRKSSALISRLSPDSKLMVRRRPCCDSTISVGQDVCAPSLTTDVPRFLGKHDGNAVADRIGKARGLAHQFLALGII